MTPAGASARLARITASVLSGSVLGATAFEFAAARRHPAAPRAAPPAAAASPNPEQSLPGRVLRGAIAQFEDALAGDLAADAVDASITYAVCKGGKVVHTRSFGWADKHDNVPASAETIYRMGSIGKTFTAVACLRLVEEGVVSLDDLVESWVPEVKRLRNYEDHAPLTIRHILTHTTGLQREPSDMSLLAGPFSQWEAKTIEALSSTGYDHPPGTKYQCPPQSTTLFILPFITVVIV